MCFQIDEFLLFFMAVFLTSWFPFCAPGTCAAVQITWPEFAKKHPFFFHPSHFTWFVRIFCSALSYQLLSFLSNFPIVTSWCHHIFSFRHRRGTLDRRSRHTPEVDIDSAAAVVCSIDLDSATAVVRLIVGVAPHPAVTMILAAAAVRSIVLDFTTFPSWIKV